MMSTKTFVKSFTILFSVFFLAGNVFAQEFLYNDSWGSQGFQITEQKANSLGVVYSINSFTLAKKEIKGEMLDEIGLPGSLLFNDEGAPNLPGQGRFIAIPEGATATVEVVASRTETFKNIEMSPAPRIPWDNEDTPLEYNKNMAIYTKDAFYPANPVQISEITEIRGVDAITLGVTPFQYNPVSKELVVYRDLKVNISFEGGNGHFGDDRLRSRWWDPILSDVFLNYQSLPKVEYSKSFQNTEDVGCDYLIVTPTNPEFLQWADSIKKFRTLQGIQTDIMTVEECGGNNVNSLESFFDNAYNSWDVVPTAILILGDYGTNSATNITSPVWDNYCVSDNIWADVSGNDMPDIIFARMTAQNASQLETMVTKFLEYERTPPTSADFYQNPITALGYQTERWFQICSEAVAGFWEVSLGKTTNRINAVYSGSPQTASSWSSNQNTSMVMAVFGPSGLGYLPSTPGQVNCTWNGSAQDVINGINNGAFMLQHRDHGSETGWGEPAFNTSHINSLNNEDLTFVWSVNCLTGKYNISGECFAEKFHRYTYNGQNSGVVGMNAASEVSYSFVNDTYVWGAYDNLWPDFLPDYGATPVERGILPAFGSAAGKYFLQASNWPYNTSNKEVTYNLFHHHGDAFLSVYSEIPQNLTVVHNPILYAGVTSFDITVDAGAFIALTVNGEIIGTGEATGGVVTINIPAQQPPDNMVVTITKQNYYRYSEIVEVIPPAGPYVVYNAVEINDAAGNGNGIMETAEEIMATLVVENVGVEEGENVSVTITTADDYVTITDDYEDYGNIAAGATSTITDGFAWEVADNIPDMHQVIFEMLATNGSDTWNTFFSVQGHGPNLEIGSMIIDDATGNDNGRLDPGENATIIVESGNSGSYDAMGAIGSLSITSSYVTITNSSYDFTVLETGATEYAEFEVSVAEETPLGTVVSMTYGLNSGGYALQEVFAETVGLIVEDWETGDMSQYEWTTGGNANWQVVSGTAYEGTYSVKSGNIGDNQNTWLELEYDVFADGEIAFMYKVSSEGSYDYLRFYIDDNEQASWSGEDGWSEAVFSITEGLHTFKWQYDKDGNVGNGSDCAWIDFVIMPPPPVTTAYAGPDAINCGMEPYETQGGATLYNIVNWMSSGSGYFDNQQSIEAVYHPSEADVANGSVILDLTAYYAGGTQVMDEMELTLMAEPVAFAGDDNAVATGSSYTINDALAENYESIMWSTNGDGSFDDATIMNPSYTPGSDDIANGTVMLSMMVTGQEPCGETMDDMVLTIGINTGIIEQDGYQLLVYPNPNNGTFSMELTGMTSENTTLLIYNILGDVVYKKEQISIQSEYAEQFILDAEPGIYFIRIEGENLLINQKVTIRK